MTISKYIEDKTFEILQMTRIRLENIYANSSFKMCVASFYRTCSKINKNIFDKN